MGKQGLLLGLLTIVYSFGLLREKDRNIFPFMRKNMNCELLNSHIDFSKKKKNNKKKIKKKPLTRELLNSQEIIIYKFYSTEKCFFFFLSSFFI